MSPAWSAAAFAQRTEARAAGRRRRLRRFHAAAGVVALLIIASFWSATVVVESFGDRAAVIAVKTVIPWGFLVLVPALAFAGLTGRALGTAPASAVVRRKSRRMAFAAANGLFVLVPAALFLAAKASAGALDDAFYVVQGLELIAGGANVVLLTLNLTAGLRMAAARRQVMERRR
ncbi:MAG: hypothetical protein AAFX81_08115 [Pseudomonadota bacterium]